MFYQLSYCKSMVSCSLFNAPCELELTKCCGRNTVFWLSPKQQGRRQDHLGDTARGGGVGDT